MSRLKMAVAAHLLLHDDAGRVLFARRAGTGYADGLWSVPAGHVEAGETLHEACVREAAEEVAVELGAGDLRLVCLQQKHDMDGEERLDAFFATSLPAGQEPRIMEAHRCDALIWVAPSRPPDPTVPYVAAALAHIGRGGGMLAYFGYGAGAD